MELTARTIDLCSAIINASQPTSIIARSTHDLLKWIARERIDEISFTKCAEKARGLAYPNANGVIIRNQIEEADRRLNNLRRAPIGLVVSGSLGRLMARDIDFCYIVSTVTVLSPYYGSERLTDVLSSMMLDDGNHVDGVVFKYEVQREPIRAVVCKIIESVFINVVNAGQKLARLTSELKKYHPHILNRRTLAGIIMGIQERDADVLLKSQHFLADVVSWILYHFEGRVEVSVGTNIVYEVELGPRKRLIRIMFDGVCPYPENCYEREGTIEVSYKIGDGNFATFLKGADDAGVEDSKPRSYERQAFYFEEWASEPILRPRRSPGLNKSDRNYALAVGKKLMKWLLNVPIEPGPSWSLGLTFKARLNEQEGKLKVRDIIKAYPSLLQMKTGVPESSAPVFKGFEPEISQYKVRDIIAMMYVFLSHLILQECIIWDEWFAVAIATSVGISIEVIGASQKNKTRASNGATSLVTAQLGSFTAVTP